MLQLEIKPYTLDFKFSARTSRGTMPDRKIWFIRITDDQGNAGVGEVAPINRLSPEEVDDIPDLLLKYQMILTEHERPETGEAVFELVEGLVPKEESSIRFGLEMALLDLINGGTRRIFGTEPERIDLPVNGLIWMGDISFMESQIKEKLDQGFRCIKLKVGANDFESELEVIKKLRGISDDIVIRLDANGAFETNEVLSKLRQLSKYNIHSIEQPILPMQPEAMEIVCMKSEIPIAFDEELTYVFLSQDRMSLIQELKPHYLVLKPTLHGGFNSVSEWIDLAEMHNVAWWITSYLESNIGLNAIAQFTGLYKNEEYHGLGTGGLYANNIVSPMLIKEGRLRYTESPLWEDIDF
ncbi:MAG: o-succinylbenzoate synthase [Ekhidna sp.]|nr:o-succinylbenzoate synthase [Ekhidna sp.]